MKTKSTLAVALLLASGVVAAQAFAQTPAPTTLTPAQRLAKLKAQRAATAAAEKARQNAINPQQPTGTPTTTPTAAPTTTPTATPTTTPTAAPTTTPTAAPTTAPTTTATAAASSSAAAAASASAAPAGSTSAAPIPPPAVLGLNLEELKKTRPDRRKAEVQQLQARWGTELLRNERAAAELKQHAQRTAYLQRIRALASKANDNKTVQAVDILITKEDTRNADAMNSLRSGALPVTAGAAK